MQQPQEPNRLDLSSNQQPGFLGEPEKAKILLNDGDKQGQDTERDV